MEVHVTDDQIGRYFRRIQLGLRFLAHGARAQSTSDWSGLTPDQLVTLRRRWLFNPDERLRGPSPTSFQFFFRSARNRDLAALFVFICRIVGLGGSRRSASRSNSTASLENGERLCEAFEIYQEWQPGASLEFEHALLLATGLTESDGIRVARCPHCSYLRLIDMRGAADLPCPKCKRKPAPLT